MFSWELKGPCDLWFQTKLNILGKSSDNFNNNIWIVVVKEMLPLAIYLKCFKQDKISLSFPHALKVIHFKDSDKKTKKLLNFHIWIVTVRINK